MVVKPWFWRIFVVEFVLLMRHLTTWVVCLVTDLDSMKSISDLIHLAELCIEVLRQNEEHHAEVCIFYLLLLYSTSLVKDINN